MTTHTAGPWHVGNKGADSVFTQDGSRLCTVMPRYDDPYRSSQEDFANARLIAAAPDLLSACQRIMQLDVSRSSDEAFRDVRAAIAKAEGETR